MNGLYILLTSNTPKITLNKLEEKFDEIDSSFLYYLSFVPIAYLVLYDILTLNKIESLLNNKEYELLDHLKYFPYTQSRKVDPFLSTTNLIIADYGIHAPKQFQHMYCNSMYDLILNKKLSIDKAQELIKDKTLINYLSRFGIKHLIYNDKMDVEKIMEIKDKGRLLDYLSDPFIAEAINKNYLSIDKLHYYVYEKYDDYKVVLDNLDYYNVGELLSLGKINFDHLFIISEGKTRIVTHYLKSSSLFKLLKENYISIDYIIRLVDNGNEQFLEYLI